MVQQHKWSENYLVHMFNAHRYTHVCKSLVGLCFNVCAIDMLSGRASYSSLDSYAQDKDMLAVQHITLCH